MTEIRTLADLDGAPHANVFDAAGPKTTKLTLEAGESVTEHRHPGRDIVLCLLEGRIEPMLDGESRDLSAGDIARFEGELDVSPTAVDDSVALIVPAGR